MNLIPWRKKHTIPVTHESGAPGRVSEFRAEMDRLFDRFFLGGTSLRGFRFSGVGPRDGDTDDGGGGESGSTVERVAGAEAKVS